MTLQILWKIQELDLCQNRLEKQLKEDKMTAKLREIKQVIINMQEQLKSIKEKHKRLKLKGDILEQKADDLHQEIKIIDERLYADENTNFKELSSHLSQLDKLKLQLKETEEEYFILLEQREGLEVKYAKLRGQLKSVQEEFKSLYNTWKNRRENIKKELDDIPATRLKLSKSVEEKLWLKYRELKKKYLAPLSRAHNGICSGCHIGLSSEDVQRVKREVIFCSFCGRILCPEDEEKSQAVG